MTTRPQACRAAALYAAPGVTDGGAGHLHQVVTVTNQGVRCTLDGYPSLVLRDDRGETVTLTQTHDGDIAFPAKAATPVVMVTGAVASFDLGYSDIPSGSERSCAAGTLLTITPPHAATREGTALRLAMAPCDHGHVAVSPFVAGAQGSTPQG